MKEEDIVGKKFNRLTPLYQVSPGKNHYWMCECDCGKIKKIRKDGFINGTIKSCGCLRSEMAIKRNNARKLPLTGCVFGKLTVIKRIGSKFRSEQWECLCECGNHTSALAFELNNGHKKSCGCLIGETTAKRNKIIMRRHGMSGTSFYGRWRSMIQRCHNPNSTSYENYGKRGIFVVDRWKKFENFYEDMYESFVEHCKKYGDDTSIDRIDNDGNYEVGNCRWATRVVQANNKRTNVVKTI